MEGGNELDARNAGGRVRFWVCLFEAVNGGGEPIRRSAASPRRSLPPTPGGGSVLGYLIPLYPPLIARKAVKWFTGGGLSPKTLANDDKLGRGPRQRQLIGEQVYYPREAFVAYLENKGVRVIDVPEM